MLKKKTLSKLGIEGNFLLKGICKKLIDNIIVN